MDKKFHNIRTVAYDGEVELEFNGENAAAGRTEPTAVPAVIDGSSMSLPAILTDSSAQDTSSRLISNVVNAHAGVEIRATSSSPIIMAGSSTQESSNADVTLRTSNDSSSAVDRNDPYEFEVDEMPPPLAKRKMRKHGKENVFAPKNVVDFVLPSTVSVRKKQTKQVNVDESKKNDEEPHVPIVAIRKRKRKKNSVDLVSISNEKSKDEKKPKRLRRICNIASHLIIFFSRFIFIASFTTHFYLFHCLSLTNFLV